jgi:polysaccharide pyruvyl transferase WcaK-like protein
MQAPARFALLTPYDGGNLGDSAIQEALIANLRACDPEIDICGITLHPTRTSVRHQIPCYPLNATSFSHYQINQGPAGKVGGEQTSVEAETSVGLYRRLRRMARKVPFLLWLKVVVDEGLHIVRSYRLLRKVDILVIAGGGQLDDEWGGSWGHPYSLAKWAVLARAARSSVVFVSVGACRIESRLTRLFLKMALSLACYRSYRDEESRQLALGITLRAEGSVVPDLAFSLPLAAIEPRTRSRSSVVRVGVSPIAYAQSSLWPTADQVQYDRYITELAGFVAEILRRGSPVTLFSSSPPDDQTFVDLHKILNAAVDSTIRGQLSTSTVGTVEELLAVLHSVDFVVASRLHGVLLSFLSTKPAIAISYDRKVTALMDELGQAVYCVDIRSFKGEELVELFSALRTNRDAVQSATAVICRQYADLLRKQYQKIAQLTRAQRPNSFQSSLKGSSDGQPFAGTREVGRLEIRPAADASTVPARGASGKTT